MRERMQAASSNRGTMRRAIVTLAAAIGLVWAAAGPAAAQKITHLTGGHGDVWIEFLTEQAALFRERTGIEIEILAMGSQQAREQYTVMLAGGVVPDVTDFWGALAGDYIALGYFTDLAPYAAREGYNLTELYQAQTLEALTYEGRLFSMPLYINPRTTYVNKDKFLESGLALPADLGEAWTWEMQREAAKKLTRDLDGNGEFDQFGIDSVTGYNWWQFVHQAGGTLYDRVLFPTESRFNTEEVLVGTEYARQLLLDDQVVGGNFAQGTAALSFTPSAQIRWELDAAGMNWDFALHAKGPYGRAAMFGIGGMQISEMSRNKEAAWKWVEFITLDVESVREYVRTNLRIPPLRQVQAEFPDLSPGLPANWRALIDAVGQANSFTLPVITRNTSAVDAAINTHMNQVWSGRIPATTALTLIHEQVSALLRQ